METKLHDDDLPIVRLRLFGALDARTSHGLDVLPKGRRARAMLAHLALSDDEAIPRRRFEDLLWSGRFTAQRRDSCRHCILELKQALSKIVPSPLIITRDTLRLDRRRIWIDSVSHQPDGVPTAPSEPLLETLRGLTPTFDAWIIATEQRLVASRAAMNVTAPTPPPIALDPEPAPAQSRPAIGPLIDVAAFVSVDADAATAHAAPALSYEVAAALARFRWLRVRHVGDREPSKRADFRLLGHIQHHPNGGRVSALLVERRREDAVAWSYTADYAERLTPSTVANFARAIAARLDPELLAIETGRVVAIPDDAAAAYDLMLKAMPLVFEYTREGWERATAYLDQAIALEPRFARALALAAKCRLMGQVHGWLAASPAQQTEMDRLISTALAADPRESLALALAAHFEAFVRHDFDAAKRGFAKALEANPSCPHALLWSVLAYAYTGNTSEARRRLKLAKQHPLVGSFGALHEAFAVVTLFFEREFAKTVRAANLLLARHPRLDNARKLKIAACAMLGEADAAREEQANLIRTEPAFSWARHLNAYPYGPAGLREQVRDALSRCGLLSNT